jgi:hypothetical protein
VTIRALRETERWVAWVRLGAVAFALFQLLLIGDDYPDATYERLAWATTAVFTAGALVLFWLSRRDLRVAALRRVGFLALAFDAAIVSSYVLIYSFESGTPIRQALFIPVIEAALRYGIRGGIVLPLVFGIVHAGFEKLMSDRFDHPFQVDNVTFAVGVLIIAGVIVGWLVERLRGQSQLAIRRANEAEALRDELGRRADLLDAANTCARALSSSLDVEQAFGAFIRELRGLVPFDRTAIVLADEESARVIATAGVGAQDVFPPGTQGSVPGSVLEEVVRSGQPVYRRDMAEPEHPEEERFLELGLRCCRSFAASRAPSTRRRSSCSCCSGAFSAPRSRTSAPTRRSVRRSRSSGGSRPSAPTSCRSSRTSSAARWRR